MRLLPILPGFLPTALGAVLSGGATASVQAGQTPRLDPAQSSSKEADRVREYRRRYEEYMKKSYIEHAGWVFDLEEARTRARREKKLIFVYFTRSYAP